MVLSRAMVKKQRGRRLVTVLAAAGLVGGILLAYSTVLAVNNTGAFELDGNAISGNAPAPFGPADDADRVCHQVLGTDCSTTSNTTGATAVTYVDSSTNLEIFTGGGSKDPQDPGTSWLWKPADTIPDKDTILHGFAARYSLPTNASTCPSADTTCQVIFFGVDRFDNSGDAQLGFWFFKSTVGLTHTSQSGGLKFSGNHQDGDLLVISDFSVGGSTSTIAAYTWDHLCGTASKGVNSIFGGTTTPGQCGSNNLRLAGFSTAANCASSAPTAAFCGIANTANGTVAPWSFTDKSGNHSYLQGEYYEAGINLSALNLGNECFSSIEGESRSSTSPTATLKDFILGNFQNCSATAVTTPSAATPVSPGTPVTDTITITGVPAGSAPFPGDGTGAAQVVFSYCGPITAGGTCDGSDTAHTAATFGASKTLSHAATQGVSTATSDAINTAASPLLPGYYCFKGSWAGDSNYPSGASDSGVNECFTVIQIGTTTVTTPSSSSGTALSGTQALGTSLYDKAVVTAAASGGGPVTGTVDFFVCNPSQVQGAAGAETCATGGSALSGNSRTLVAVSPATDPPSASVLSSPAVVANAAGVWCFRAVYNPTGTVYTTSSDASHGECVTVGPESTTTVTTPSVGSNATVAVNASVTDHAVVTAADNSDGTPTGTINFFICNPTVVAANGGTCSANGTAAGSVTAAAVAGSNPPASSADSSSITANAVGTWCFRAVYVPGGANGANYTTSSDASTTECFLVQDSTLATSAQTWLPNDTGSVAATGGTALSGTLSIQLYEGGTCAAGSEVSGQVYSKTLTGATTLAARSLTTGNTSYSVSTSKSVSWLVTFTPAAGSNVTGNSHCESTALTITN